MQISANKKVSAAFSGKPDVDMEEIIIFDVLFLFPTDIYIQ